MFYRRAETRNCGPCVKLYQSLDGGKGCGFAHEARELISLPSSGDEEWVGAVR